MSRNINEVDIRLQNSFRYAKKVFNEKYKGNYCIKISAAKRTTEEQQNLYRQGRKVIGSIVTNCDGVENLSKHQTGEAIDVYILDLQSRGAIWHNINNMYYEFAYLMLEYNTDLTWGGHFSNNLDDIYHFEV